MADYMLDAIRWRRIEEVFHSLADIPAGARRDETLSSLCGGDPELAAHVRRLLAEDHRLASAGVVADPHIGLRLGSYEIDELIARGGMAAVYKAHRADDEFDQRVAIKIMDLRLSDPALVARFKAERQILAALEHPTLTRLLDGGVSGFGEPYLVMEYIEGAPIDQYCDRHRLDLAARIALFAQVCAGVAFAHRNLVLHRDLKPSNILVTADGHPKVVDFGTATLLEPERLATVSRAPLTPAYASPEQLTGQSVATASDQYSLGLVLYELVTGVAAFGNRPSLIGSIERALAGSEPPPPHLAVADGAADLRRTSPSRLRRLLSGDLGTIVRKTLAPDPSARYSSVEHVADDLDRWVRGEPILGRPPSVGYRTSRFVRRHWMPVSVAVTLLVSLVVTAAVSLRQATIARAEAGKARELNRLLGEIVSSADPKWANVDTDNVGSASVRQVLDAASERISANVGNSPEVEAEMRRTIARTYLRMGATDRATPQLERALALYTQLGDDFGLAATEQLLGSASVQRGDFAGAEAYLRKALAYVRSRGADADPELHQNVLAELGTAIAYQHPGHAEALALWREAIAVADRVGFHPATGVIQMSNIGLNLIRLGRLDEGEAALRDALRRMDALGYEMTERYSVLRSLGVALYVRGEYEEAARMTGAAAEGMARSRAPDHPLQPNFQIWWGRALLAVGDLSRGGQVVRDAYAAYRKRRPEGHLELALPLIAMGTLHRLEGNLPESERVIRQAREILRQSPASKDRDADAAGELGLTLRAAGRTVEADALFTESHAILEATYGDDHPSTKQALARTRHTHEPRGN
jgi:serine/threonine protein kinase/tetratricopeptide (TPR) repeat protein